MRFREATVDKRIVCRSDSRSCPRRERYVRKDGKPAKSSALSPYSGSVRAYLF